jgi:hypothetical protein
MLLTLAGVSVVHAEKAIKPQDSAWLKRAPVAFPVPLVGFAEAYAGRPFAGRPVEASPRGSPERPFVCAAAGWGKAEWRGCSMKPIQTWGK